MRFSLLLLAAALHAQTLGQFRLVDFSARTPGTVSAVTLGTNPAITTSAPHGRTTGDAVWIYEPWDVDRREVDAVGNAPSGNRGRGYFIVAVTDSTHFTLASEMYTGRTNLTAYTVAVGDKIVPLTTYTLRDGPKVWLDGPISKGAWSNATTYRAYDSVTSGGNTYMSVQDSNLNHATSDTDWWKQVDPAKVGPGTFSASLRNTSGKASTTGTYTPLKALQTNLSTYFPTGASSYFDFTVQNFGFTGWTGQGYALNWMMTGDSTSYTRALQLATRAEDLAGGTVACNGTAYCGFRFGSGDSGGIDYERLYAAQWTPAAAMIYESLTSAQKQGFRDRVLNDNDILHNGTEDSGQGCTPFTYISGTSTMTLAGNTSTGVEVATVAAGGLSALSDLTAGSVIIQVSPLRVLGRVNTKDSDTQLTFEPIVPTQALTIASGFSWYYTKPWAYGGAKTCGWTHFIKHVTNTPHMIPGLESQWSTDYGTTSAISEDDWGENNRTISGLTPFIALALALGQDDIRAVRLGEQAINYYMTQTLAQYYKSRMTGKDGHGTEYGAGRTENLISQIAVMISNSFTTTPAGVVSGNYLKNMLASYQYVPWLARTGWVQPWSVAYGAATKDSTDPLGSKLDNMGKPMLYGAYLYPSDDFAGAVYHYMRTRRTVSYPFWTSPSYGSSSDGWSLITFLSVAVPFYDPLASAVDPTSKPKYLVQNTSDISECIAAGLYCVPDTNSSNMWSMSGWTDTATQVHIAGNSSGPVFNEDSYGVAGNVTILQNNGSPNAAYLLGGNGLGASGYGYGATPFGGMEHGNILSVWDGSVDLLPDRSDYQYAHLDRSGAGSGYAYARVNLTPSLRDAAHGYDSGQTSAKGAFAASAGVTRAQRHVIHFTGGTNHVVVYDDIAASTPNQLRAYWHYEIADLANPPVRHTDRITGYDASARTVQLTVSGVGRLNTKVLPVGGSNSIALAREDRSQSWCTGGQHTFNPSDSCVGNYSFRDTSGPGVPAAVDTGTYRVHVCTSSDGSTCANATSGEWITVHRSSTSGSDTMPTITQPSCTGTGGNCAVVEIQDASAPSVAVFARQGSGLTNAVFTSSHSGSAQYVLAGLASGHITVFKDGVMLTSGDVSDGDNTLAFASTAGTFSLSSAPVLTVSPGSLSMTCYVGGSATPQSVSVGAVGVTLDQWAASKTQSWLTVTPTSGTATGTITASASCVGLTAGSYSDTITVSSSTVGIGNSPVTVPVSLTVSTLTPGGTIRGTAVRGVVIR